MTRLSSSKIIGITVVVYCVFFNQSCIQKEAPNSECDIEKCIFHIEHPENLFFNLSDSVVNVPYGVSEITINSKQVQNIDSVIPEFVLSQGATIYPGSMQIQNFSNNDVKYTVTSEDHKWSRDYIVKFNICHLISLKQDFEKYHLNSTNSYYEWFDLSEMTTDNNLSPNIWSSGNSGYRLTSSSAKPSDYPTTFFQDGYVGSAVKLTTQSTGMFGSMVNMRLAAGNFFIGSFDATYALTDPMKTICLGKPFSKKPLKITGYYQYTPGDTYQDRNGKTIDNVVDSADIYAILYRNVDADGNSVILHGDNFEINPNIVGFARVNDIYSTSEWTRFEMIFDYDSYDEKIDVDLLSHWGYNLAMVFSSSSKGNLFCGAIGSTLLIDEVEIVCEQ